MKGSIFEVDLKQLNRIHVLAREAPREFRRASSMVINDMAFFARKEAIKQIETGMIARDPRFISRMMRVEKTRAVDISRQQALMGSLRKGKFTGWKEQEFGLRAQRNRTSTLAARGSSRETRMRPSMRLRPSSRFPKPSEYPGSTERNRAAAMLAMLSRENFRRPFILQGGKWRPGLYKFARGKKRIATKSGKYKSVRRVQRIQAFDKSYRPKRIRWMTNTRHFTIHKFNMGAGWNRALDRLASYARRG